MNIKTLLVTLHQLGCEISDTSYTAHLLSVRILLAAGQVRQAGSSKAILIISIMVRRGERPPWDCEKDIKSNGLLSAGLFCSQRDFTPPALITNAATTGRGHYCDWEYWGGGRCYNHNIINRSTREPAKMINYENITIILLLFLIMFLFPFLLSYCSSSPSPGKDKAW